MRAMKGKTSDLAVISKCFNYLSYLSQPHKANRSPFPISSSFRLLSTINDRTGDGKFRKTDRSDFNGRRSYDDDKFSGKNGGNFSTHQNFRHSRSERQAAQFRGQTASPNYRRQGRNDGFNNRANSMKLNDDFLKFDDDDKRGEDVGLAGDQESKKDYQPSVSDLLNRSLKGEQGSRNEGGDFLEKFKLGGVDKTENKSSEPSSNLLPQEEKMEPPENADEIFKKMKQTGLIPNAVAMLDGLCKDGLVQEAMKLFGLMREKGSMPEVVVYTAVVEGFCQAHKLEDAKRIFRKMQNNGIVPNAFSFTVLIKGLCKGKNLEDAVDFCVEMLEAGHSPNVTTFTGLVHEFCKEKGVEEAQKMIGSLKLKGFILDDKAVRSYLDKTGPTSPMVWEAIFGPKKTTQRTF